MKKRLLGVLTLMTVFLIACLAFAGCSRLELKKPENIRYDGATITWNAVENANKYTVRIDDGEEITVTENKRNYTSTKGDFTVKICAVSDLSGIVKSGESVVSFTALEQIQTLNLADGKLTWDLITDATAYEVKSGTNTEIVTDALYDPQVAGHYSVQVRPIVQGNDTYWSKWSPTKTFDILGVVNKDNVRYENGKIKWDTVNGATGYQVLVGGVEIAAKNVGTSIDYDSNNENFEVQIKALGNATTVFDGAMSEVKSFVYLDTVTNIQVVDGILTWDEIPNASKYEIKLNNKTVIVDKADGCKYAGLSANVTTAVSIRPICDDTTYFSDWSNERSILILPSPSAIWDADREPDGEVIQCLHWDAVSGAEGYAVKLVLPNGEEKDFTYGKEERAFSHDFKDVGDYKIYIKALAKTATDNYDSKYSDALTVTRLPAPTFVAGNYLTSDARRLNDGFTVTFNKVSKATAYKLCKDGNEIDVETTNQFRVTDTVGSDVQEGREITYTIKAVGKDNNNGSREIVLSSLTSDSLSFNISVLPMPQTVDISGFVFSYGSVTGNNGYVVDIGGASYDADGTSRDLSHLEAGSFNVSVCTKGNGSNVLPSNYTAAINVVRLEEPKNLKISAPENAEGKLEFVGDEHARSYELIFNNDSNPIPLDQIPNINEKISVSGTTIHMYSVANEFSDLITKKTYYMTSQSSITYTFIKLRAPTFNTPAFSEDGTELIWNHPDGLNTQVYTPTYEVYKPDDTLWGSVKSDNRYDISAFAGDKQYTFQVKALGDGDKYVSSDKSDPIQIYKLGTPVVERTDGKYIISQVSRATNYVVKVDGVVAENFVHLDNKFTYEYVPKLFTMANKTYQVEIIAIGDGGIQTVNSSTCLIEQKTAIITTPDKQDFDVSFSLESYDPSGKIIVEINKEPAQATGYYYFVGGAEGVKADTRYEVSPLTTGQIKVAVGAIGGSFDSEKTYYIDSPSSEVKTITLLDHLSQDSIKLRDGLTNQLSWTAVAGAVSYKVGISTDGGATYTYSDAYSTMFTIENYQSLRSLSVSIQAIGNGTNIINSKVTTKDWPVLNQN